MSKKTKFDAEIYKSMNKLPRPKKCLLNNTNMMKGNMYSVYWSICWCLLCKFTLFSLWLALNLNMLLCLFLVFIETSVYCVCYVSTRVLNLLSKEVTRVVSEAKKDTNAGRDFDSDCF